MAYQDVPYLKLPDTDLVSQAIDLKVLVGNELSDTGSIDVRALETTSLGRLLQAFPIAAVLLDHDHTVVFANNAWSETFRSYSEGSGGTFESLFADGDRSTIVQSMIDEVFADRKAQICEGVLHICGLEIWGRMHMRSLRMDTERYILAIVENLTAEKTQLSVAKEYSRQLRSAHGQLEKRVAIRTRALKNANEELKKEIAERKKAEAEREKLVEDLTRARDALHFQATHDGLTGIWNRSAILDVLKNELVRAEREGTDVGVILADIDHFKKVNDRYGHVAGDAVLREVARRMTTVVRPYDSVGRYGGEEFIIIVPGCKGEEVAGIAERLRADTGDRPVHTREISVSVTVSFGVAASGNISCRDIDSLIKAADEALYRAKNLGRNSVCYASN